MFTFKTFDELVRRAIHLGATHMTMGNFHSGAFWKYTTPKNLEQFNELEMEVFTDVLGEGWTEKKGIRAVSHFHDNDLENYLMWTMTPFTSTGGIELNSQFIPIEEAASWYRNWNRNYKGGKNE